ncbi:hypothetical protein BBJ28_00018689 [Nothophytophthora sp. Chile5]|nr:hypothetical protein BBJ28_00018689 [Nothophytophthora sp. Chile5]
MLTVVLYGLQIPVYLVESPVLNEQCNAHNKTSTLMNGNKPVKGHVTRGLCLSEVSQIQHMVRHGKNAVPRVTSIEKIEEGMCQLMSYLFLKYKHMVDHKGSEKHTYEARLREFYMEQLENDLSPVYGDGFREAFEAYQRTNSLQTMFDAIRRHAMFP